MITDRSWFDRLLGSAFGEFVRCTAAGGVAFSLDLLVLTTLVAAARMHYLVAAAIGFGLGTILNYQLNVRWVFVNRRVSSAALEFQLFAAICLVGLGINEGLMWGLTGFMGLHYLTSKLASASVVYCWTFAARKFVLF